MNHVCASVVASNQETVPYIRLDAVSVERDIQ
jgi:hypothetical protein